MIDLGVASTRFGVCGYMSLDLDDSSTSDVEVLNG